MAKKKARRKSSARKKSASSKTGKKKTATRKSRRKYSAKASETVERAMHKRKHGTLRSGKGGRGGRVTSREQAIAIGLSEAREKGARVPEKKP